ncbi:acyl-CoA/acyl-ACP dehydrogenase [Nocardia sp. NBC_00881]|uniref:acyl-CoA dehydrogenase family protein n=1 Tax=Nocardia sp. NBC_00881 TaxID=2975995 RepID=UPI003865304A|nr:acyl-CoA/acyl-ACP dehydrogenase [Nocardia sp. NBC_00881]
MDFAYSPEHAELGAVVRKFLAEVSPESEVRRLMTEEQGCNPAVWNRMATEIGVQSLAIPEQFGGSGFGLLELGVVFEETGRALLPAPLLSSVGSAAHALLASGAEGACARYLPDIASGRLVATLALTEESGSWTEQAVTTRAVAGSSGWQVTGTKCYVLDGQRAHLLLVVARSEAGTGLFAIDREAAGVQVAPQPTLDPTRRFATVELRDAPAQLVGADGAGWAAVEQALLVSAVLLAAEQVGGTSAVLDMAVEYAKTREQFGRPIGSFQAIKHKAAEMLLRLEAARSAVLYALWSLQTAADDRRAAVSLAKSYCSEAFSFCAGENMQIHGGIGFTWEHSAHLYLRRAKSCESLFGSPTFHRERIAALAGF